MTLSPKRVASHKASPIVRTFQKLAGMKMGRAGVRQMMLSRKQKTQAEIWAGKLGKK